MLAINCLFERGIKCAFTDINRFAVATGGLGVEPPVKKTSKNMVRDPAKSHTDGIAAMGYTSFTNVSHYQREYSWKYMLAALRVGDFKGRRRPTISKSYVRSPPFSCMLPIPDF